VGAQFCWNNSKIDHQQSAAIGLASSRAAMQRLMMRIGDVFSSTPKKLNHWTITGMTLILSNENLNDLGVGLLSGVRMKPCTFLNRQTNFKATARQSSHFTRDR
jgi:hypothetical protein